MRDSFVTVARRPECRVNDIEYRVCFEILKTIVACVKIDGHSCGKTCFLAKVVQVEK